MSDIVGSLADRDLILETTLKSSGRGRPAKILNFNSRRYGGILLSVVDRSIRASAVDMDCNILAEIKTSPPPDANNADLSRAIDEIVAEIAAKFPQTMEICGIVAALAGILDVPRGYWCVSSRWPKMDNLDICRALAHHPSPVTLVRNLDAELSGLFHRNFAKRDENILLLHWGHGIGASYAANGQVINEHRGRFCEIGHWQLANGLGRVCTCGNTDCLETVAAIWAIEPALREQYPDLPTGERELASAIADIDIMRSKVFSEALEQVLRIAGNLCRLLFPDRIILSGPLVQNPEIFRRFDEAFVESRLLRTVETIRVDSIKLTREFEVQGAMSGTFDAALRGAVGM